MHLLLTSRPTHLIIGPWPLYIKMQFQGQPETSSASIGHPNHQANANGIEKDLSKRSAVRPVCRW